jgi:hypothetical protein
MISDAQELISLLLLGAINIKLVIVVQLICQ